MVETGLDFGVLGPLEVTANGALLPLGGAKQRAVLAMLVINRNRAVALDSLTGAAWEDFAPQGARTSLHSYVSNLRRLLGTAGVDSRTVLASAPPGYRLTVPDAACDLGRFIAEKTAGVQAAAAGRLEQASDHLSAALGQWRGHVLEDLRDFRFVETFARALVEEKVVAHTVRAEAEIACGRAHSVIGELEALIVEQPYREPLWAQLMTAYYSSGRQSDALETYRRLTTTLAEDLGIDPGPSVRDLHERILRQEPLDVKHAAKTSAQDIATALEQRFAVSTLSIPAQLRHSSGRCYRLDAVATGIGRLADNDIVVDDPKVSRHHAVIIDTGTSYVINDLRSANGVEVRDQRIHGSATLTDGDVLRIGGHRFIFEISSGEAHD
jgi:SARP family transcriptional regulator, regulator of embCAB operon